jgi:hypothetical protein
MQVRVNFTDCTMYHVEVFPSYRMHLFSEFGCAEEIE